MLDKTLYARRNAVERLIGWLKEHRSLATRFDKTAASFLAMVKLACIRRLLRASVSVQTLGPGFVARKRTPRQSSHRCSSVELWLSPLKGRAVNFSGVVRAPL